jgi:hypothetical protein
MPRCPPAQSTGQLTSYREENAEQHDLRVSADARGRPLTAQLGGSGVRRNVDARYGP